MILDKIDELLKEVQELSAKNAEEVEQLRLKYLSKKGEITALMNDFRNVAADQKKTVGMKINELKTLATERINQLREECETQETGEEALDLTRTPYPVQLGTRHPLTIVTNEIIDIFSRMGFVLADGPEVEDDLHVFTKMNFAADHPARDMQDTFFVSQHPDDVTKNILLRSHTSSVQARIMERMHDENGKLTSPIRVICPGRVYRNEAITARAHCFFHQVEGLYIDKNVSFTDLKQVLLSFAKEMFGADTKIRLRPSYFPFTEPSAEMDISCFICGGEGCGFCKHTGWVLWYGRSQRARALRYRLQGIHGLRLRHGCRAHHQPEIPRLRPPYVLRKRHVLPRGIRSSELNIKNPHPERWGFLLLITERQVAMRLQIDLVHIQLTGDGRPRLIQPLLVFHFLNLRSAHIHRHLEVLVLGSHRRHHHQCHHPDYYSIAHCDHRVQLLPWL